jgi:archaellum component FlaC
MLPATGSNSFTPPRIADWVFGFFQDGEAAQIPVVMGVFPGIESQQSRTLYQEIVNKKGGGVPKTPFTGREAGQPITPVEIRQVVSTVTGGVAAATSAVKTIVDTANEEIDHICDISKEVSKAVSWVKNQFGPVVEKIRLAILAILKALGFEPSGVIAQAIQFAKKILEFIKYITDMIKEVTEQLQILIQLATLIRLVIDYINKLPERFKKLLQDCLKKLEKQLRDGFTNIFVKPDGFSSSFGLDLKELRAAVKDVKTAVGDLKTEVNTISKLPGKITETLLTPSSPEALSNINGSVNGVINGVTTAASKMFNRNTPSANTVGNGA